MGGLRIARIFGIDVRVHLSWAFIALLVLFSLGSVFSASYQQAHPATIWTAAVITTLALFASLLMHELAHSLVALALGIEVPAITLFIFGGISHLREEPSRPRDELLIAVVGPLTSILIGLAFILASLLAPAETLLATALGWLGVINCAIGVFNCLPGFPLDGGRILRAISWGITGNFKRATRHAAAAGTVIAVGLMVVGLLEALTGPLFGGLWLIVIGWFLLTAVRSTVVQSEIREAMGGLHVGQVMRDCPLVAGSERVDHLIQGRILATGRTAFLVHDDGEKAIVTLDMLRRLDPGERAELTVGEVAVPLADLPSLAPEDDGEKAMRAMEAADSAALPVVRDGRTIGIVQRDDLLARVGLDLELGGGADSPPAPEREREPGREREPEPVGQPDRR